MTTVTVRLAEIADQESLAQMRALLWPHASVEEHGRELQSLLFERRSGTMPADVFVSCDARGTLTGFLEIGLRSHADGCDPARPVGFIEGWCVADGWRRRGVGQALMQAAEEWARCHGCVEMASDTWINHLASQEAHEAPDFEIVVRCVHFRKKL
jgi:aminoglycoside 6'-N-acetyltransferase I